MEIHFQPPLTQHVYAEVKDKEAKTAKMKFKKQLPSKPDGTSTSAPGKQTVVREPVLKDNLSFSVEEPTYQATDIDPASNMLSGTASRKQNTAYELTSM